MCYVIGTSWNFSFDETFFCDFPLKFPSIFHVGGPYANQKLNESAPLTFIFGYSSRQKKLQPHSVWKDSAAVRVDYFPASFTRECTCVQLYMAFISFSYARVYAHFTLTHIHRGGANENASAPFMHARRDLQRLYL